MDTLEELEQFTRDEVRNAKAYLYQVLPPHALEFIRDHQGLNMPPAMDWLLTHTDLDPAWVAEHSPSAYYATCEMHLELQEAD